jgi:hypothetical protein
MCPSPELSQQRRSDMPVDLAVDFDAHIVMKRSCLLCSSK